MSFFKKYSLPFETVRIGENGLEQWVTVGNDEERRTEGNAKVKTETVV